MTDSLPTSPLVRFVVDLCSGADGVSGWIRREDAAAVPFSGWRELLALLEPPVGA